MDDRRGPSPEGNEQQPPPHEVGEYQPAPDEQATIEALSDGIVDIFKHESTLLGVGRAAVRLIWQRF